MYFSESHWQSDISSISKVISVLGKARSDRAPNLGCRGAEAPGGFEVLPKCSAWDMMHELVLCCDVAANHQLPTAAAFWIIWIVSAEECSSLMQNLVQIRCSAHLVTLNATATHYTYSTASTVKLSLFMHAHSREWSPWLPGYIDVMQTVLIILTMAGLFPDRLHISYYS